ncbi:MAG TPA: hypothetical protein VHP80_13160 [Candidatus Acidoferrum sp.]|jgi:hypothetical protein|nr:hypothetical protein [Candidatus Acidoferrum sp.]
MEKTNIAPQDIASSVPVESKFPPILRAIGLGVLVLILWSIDKFAAGRLPTGSAWRYVIGAVIISLGLATVISISDRLSNKDS